MDIETESIEVAAKRLGPNLWWFARMLGASPSDAEDLVQEALISAWRAGFDYRSDAEAAVYLRQSVVRSWASLNRKLGRSAASVDPQDAEELWQDWRPADNDGPAMLAMELCLKELDARQRDALAMRYQRDLSLEESARELGIKREGVHSLLKRTRAKLKKCIEARMQK